MADDLEEYTEELLHGFPCEGLKKIYRKILWLLLKGCLDYKNENDGSCDGCVWEDVEEMPECQNLGCAARGTPYCDVLGEHKTPGVCAGYMPVDADDEP